MSRQGPVIEEVSSSSDDEAFFDAVPKAAPVEEKVEEGKKEESEFDRLVKERTEAKKPTEPEMSEEAKLTPEEIEARTKKAEEKKTEGNKNFNAKEYQQAIYVYSDGIEIAPPKSQIKSVLYGNRAACHLALEDHKKVIEDADKAIEIDDKYAKVYLRRAQSHRKLNDYRSSLKDFEKVVELMKDEAPLDAKRSIKELAPLAKQQEEEEKEKMLGELKNLGNKFLGLFGLSLDNFQMKQDPTTGSYSVNFGQGGGAPASGEGSANPDGLKKKDETSGSGDD